MNKKIIVIGIAILLLIFGGVCVIDHHRMSNNEPVLFSTWGKQYVPPEYLIVKGIEDKTQKQNIACAEQEELFYEDSENEYYFDCIKSQYIIVSYKNGYKEDVKSALKNKNIKISDLDDFGIYYTVNKKQNGVKEEDIFYNIHGELTNVEKLNAFLNNMEKDIEERESDFIRVTRYTIEGDPINLDIKYVKGATKEDSYYEITKDNTADRFGTREIKTDKYDYNWVIKRDDKNGIGSVVIDNPNSENEDKVTLFPYTIE